MFNSATRNAVQVLCLLLAYSLWALSILQRTRSTGLHFRFNHVAGLNTIVWLMVQGLWKAVLEFVGILLLYAILSTVLQIVLQLPMPAADGSLETADVIGFFLNAGTTVAVFGCFGERLFFIKYRFQNKV